MTTQCNLKKEKRIENNWTLPVKAVTKFFEKLFMYKTFVFMMKNYLKL